MVIKILGTGCSKCKKLEQNTKEAVDQLGVVAEIQKVEDVMDIMKYGVMKTPALVVDEKVVVSGRVAKPKEIADLIK